MLKIMEILSFHILKKKTNNKLDLELINNIKNKKIWCAASTHPNEEILCGKAHLKIKKNYKDVLTIIIPRHIDRVKKINNDLLNLNLKVALYSKLNLMDYDTDILIVDSYGESLKFYDICKYVFVGKSLAKNLIFNSGQNPIEPARLGCKIFHGPNVNNFSEIYEYLNELKITKKILNYEELGSAIVEEFRTDKPKNDKIAEKIENYGQNIFNNVNMELNKYI